MRGFRKDLPNATKHDLDLLSTFSLSWEQIKDDPARKVFVVAGYCAPNTPIPPEIFEQTLGLDETDLRCCAQYPAGAWLAEGECGHPSLAGRVCRPSGPG